MEDIIVTYNVPHSEPFGFLIVLFISVTGLNTGSYLASFIFTYLGWREDWTCRFPRPILPAHIALALRPGKQGRNFPCEKESPREVPF